MYNLQIIEERTMLLLEKQHLSKNKLLENSGLNKSVFDNMKKGQKPSIDKIHILADYLDCSVDYLLGRTDNPAAHKQASHAIFSYNSDVQGGIGNNSRISIGGSAPDCSDEQLQELIRLYSSLSPRKKAELLILVDDFVKNE